MVLDDVSHLNHVLQAWRTAGVRGVTILESTGLNRLLRRQSAEPVYAGFSQIFGSARVGHNTLFAVIDDLELAEAAVNGTEKVIGSLDTPHTGIIFAVPVTKTWGIPDDAQPE
jgi:hypothetical protein